jgi:hypothetical protein
MLGKALLIDVGRSNEPQGVCVAGKKMLAALRRFRIAAR